jgi:hypothetical protein
MKNKARYEWSEKHAQILDNYLKKLKSNNIRYFILRNFEGLPEINESKDVDLIIEPESYKKASKILLETFKEFNIKRYSVVRFERVRCWRGMDYPLKFSIHIDLIEGYLNKGFEIFKFDELYENTVKYKDYTVLDKPYDAAMLLLYKVIASKQLKDRYVEKIDKIYSESKEKIDKIIIYAMGNELGNEVVGLLTDKDYEKIVKKASEISKITKKKAFVRRPFYTTVNIIKFWCEKFYRIAWCPRKYRKMIAVEAPDGTGKTTFIDGLAVTLSEMFLTDLEQMHIYHFRPTILPNLGAVGEKAGVMEQDKDFTNPHRNKPANPFSSFVRMVYYWIDYVIGGFICIRKDVQFDKFTIFDRYIYDFIVDPVRSRISLPRWIRVMFSKLVYKPKFVFVLMADTDVIYERKQELTKEEISRQLKEFNRLTESGKRFVKLDANRNPEEIINEAAEILINQYTREV